MITGKENVEVAWDWGVRRSRNIEIFSFLHLFFFGGGWVAGGLELLNIQRPEDFFSFFFVFLFVRRRKNKNKRTPNNRSIRPPSPPSSPHVETQRTHKLKRKQEIKKAIASSWLFAWAEKVDRRRWRALRLPRSVPALVFKVSCFVSFRFFFFSCLL